MMLFAQHQQVAYIVHGGHRSVHQKIPIAIRVKRLAKLLQFVEVAYVSKSPFTTEVVYGEAVCFPAYPAAKMPIILEPLLILAKLL